MPAKSKKRYPVNLDLRSESTDALVRRVADRFNISTSRLVYAVVLSQLGELTAIDETDGLTVIPDWLRDGLVSYDTSGEHVQ